MIIENNRTCLYTKEKLNKTSLLRFVIINDLITIDLNYNLSGRGYYIKKDYNIVKLVLESNFLKKRLKKELDEKTLKFLKGGNYEYK